MQAKIDGQIIQLSKAGWLENLDEGKSQYIYPLLPTRLVNCANKIARLPHPKGM